MTNLYWISIVLWAGLLWKAVLLNGAVTGERNTQYMYNWALNRVAWKSQCVCVCVSCWMVEYIDSLVKGFPGFVFLSKLACVLTTCTFSGMDINTQPWTVETQIQTMDYIWTFSSLDPTCSKRITICSAKMAFHIHIISEAAKKQDKPRNKLQPIQVGGSLLLWLMTCCLSVSSKNIHPLAVSWHEQQS